MLQVIMLKLHWKIIVLASHIRYGTFYRFVDYLLTCNISGLIFFIHCLLKENNVNKNMFVVTISVAIIIDVGTYEATPI